MHFTQYGTGTSTVDGESIDIYDCDDSGDVTQDIVSSVAPNFLKATNAADDIFRSTVVIDEYEEDKLNRLSNWQAAANNSRSDISSSVSKQNTDCISSRHLGEIKEGTMATNISTLCQEKENANYDLKYLKPFSGRLGNKPETDILHKSKSKQQLQAYVAWTNSQLKRRGGTGVRVIDDLRHDVQDGVALVQLVEVLSGDKLMDVCVEPYSLTEMTTNVEKVLEFMAAHRIRMHYTSAKDIVEGNLKSIMRLILALAVHYKPNSVKLSAQKQMQRAAGSQTSAGTTQGLQNAAVAIADAKREAMSSGHKLHKPADYQQVQRQQDREHRFSYFKPPASHRVHRSSNEESEHYSHSSNSPLGSISNSPASSIRVSSPTSSEDAASSKNLAQSKSMSDFQQARTPTTTPLCTTPTCSTCDLNRSENDAAIDSITNQFSELWENLLSEHDGISENMTDSKDALLKLQDLLLYGVPPDGESENSSLPIEGSTQDEQAIILKNKLQLAEELVKDLRDELSSVRGECMQLQGTKTGLQQRLTEQENAFLQMKADFLRKEITHQNMDSEKMEFQRKLNEKDSQLKELRRESSQKDRLIQQLKDEQEQQKQERDSSVKMLRTHIQTLSEKLQKVGETEAVLSAKVASQDRKMARLEGKIKHESTTQQQQQQQQQKLRSPLTYDSSSDCHIIQTSIQNMRSNLQFDDQSQGALDALEHTLSAFTSRLNTIQPKNKPIFDHEYIVHNGPGDIRQRSAHAFNNERLDNGNHYHDQNLTKILYFSEDTDTPFMCTLPKRLGTVTLKDFKQIYDRDGSFRYHFKALDPEFGTVKEEISNEEAILPGWEGKIVAWVEEDHG